MSTMARDMSVQMLNAFCFRNWSCIALVRNFSSNIMMNACVLYIY